MTLRTITIVAALILAGPAAAFAQIDQTSWGLAGAFTPRWAVPARVGVAFDAEKLNVTGRELRIGVIRGTTLGGEWGVSLVHKRFNKTSDVTVDGSDGVARFVTEDSELLGVEAHRFMPFTRIGDRMQVGVNVAGGIAEMRGFVRGEYRSLRPGAQSFAALVPTRDIFEYTGRNVRVLPLAKAELAVTALIGDRAKVRVSGGLNLPGFEIVNFSFSYLLGQDR